MSLSDSSDNTNSNPDASASSHDALPEEFLLQELQENANSLNSNTGGSTNTFGYHNADGIICVAISTQEYLYKLFAKGFTALESLHQLKEDLKLKFGDGYAKISKDGAVLCSNVIAARMYKKYTAENGDVSSEQVTQVLMKLIKDYNSHCGRKSAHFEAFQNDAKVIAIMTPAMRKISQLWPSSGREMIILTWATPDNPNYCIILLATPSPIGVLPIGVIITTSLSKSVILRGFHIYFTLLCDDCFGGKGKSGPDSIFTEDFLLMTDIAKTVFPRASVFIDPKSAHLSAWKWVWQANIKKITKLDRVKLMKSWKEIFESNSFSELEENFSSLQEDERMNQLDSFCTFMEKAQKKKDSWGLLFRRQGTAYTYNSHDSPEYSYQTLMDYFVHHLKYRNIAVVTQVVITRVNDHLCNILEEAISSSSYQAFQRTYQVHNGNVKSNCTMKLSGDQYEVLSFTTDGVKYYVNTSVRRCSCFEGRLGYACKHQGIVAQLYPTTFATENSSVSLSDEHKAIFRAAMADSSRSVTKQLNLSDCPRLGSYLTTEVPTVGEDGVIGDAVYVRGDEDDGEKTRLTTADVDNLHYCLSILLKSKMCDRLSSGDSLSRIAADLQITDAAVETVISQSEQIRTQERLMPQYVQTLPHSNMIVDESLPQFSSVSMNLFIAMQVCLTTSKYISLSQIFNKAQNIWESFFNGTKSFHYKWFAQFMAVNEIKLRGRLGNEPSTKRLKTL